MKLEKIIDKLGERIKRTLVIKRELITEPTFKAFKTYRITLFEVQKGIVTEVCNAQIKDKILEANKDKIVEKVEELLLEKIFEKYVDRN